MERVSVPKPETREVCTACGQVDGYHLQKCRISELQAEVERLREAFDDYMKYEWRQRAEQAERKLAEAVAALRKYGKHDSKCRLLTWIDPVPTPKCTCGFDEVTK